MCFINDKKQLDKFRARKTSIRIRKPLKDRALCSSGLYFYAEQRELFNHSYTKQITAKVKPEHIIAVSSRGTIICCTEAKVIEAPDPKSVRLEWLQPKLKLAERTLSDRKKEWEKWEAEQENQKKTIETMKEEIENLKKK